MAKPDQSGKMSENRLIHTTNKYAKELFQNCLEKSLEKQRPVVQ